MISNSTICLTWDKFKIFFRKNLGKTITFANNIRNKIRKKSQYKENNVQDWVVYFKHL